MERPTLRDPAEWATIKDMYFDSSRPAKDDTDPIERLERMQSRERNLHNSPR